MTRAVAWLAVALIAVGCGAHAPPSVVSAPKYPAYPKPEIPRDLSVPPDVRQLHETAWQRLQSGDLRGASRDFSDVLKRAPEFYPAEAGLGYAAMADRQFKQAAVHFGAAVMRNPAYVPALRGQVDAQLAAGDDAGSIAAIEQLLLIEPAHDDLRNRADLIRLRTVQAQLETAARARAAGHLDEAQHTLEHALAGAPANPVLLRELASIELARGTLDAADAHARSAVQLDSGDPESLAVLGGVLEAQGRFAEAAAAFASALAVDPRPAWKDKHDKLDARAKFEALPAEYRSIPAAATVTRGQLAAMIGIELKTMIDAAPRQQGIVVTDIRTHWAAAWILSVTQAGVMEALPNHTFQPNAVVRRMELAQVLSQLLGVAALRRPSDIAAWRAARPAISDVPAGHTSYRAVAMVTASGLMPLDADGRFSLTRAVSGAELVAAVGRLKLLAGR
jgi:Tfp pilus assembly protein PilF